jgi:hypothetical protein
MLIVKHLFDWSYGRLKQEVRANLMYRDRRFCGPNSARRGYLSIEA